MKINVIHNNTAEMFLSKVLKHTTCYIDFSFLFNAQLFNLKLINYYFKFFFNDFWKIWKFLN
jgi:hypothetical protein